MASILARTDVRVKSNLERSVGSQLEPLVGRNHGGRVQRRRAAKAAPGTVTIDHRVTATT